MKHSREPEDSVDSVSQGPSRQRPKRPKTSQACTSCRKHKTRCELLARAAGPVRCHRCEVLSISCSYETSKSLPLPAAPKSSSIPEVITPRGNELVRSLSPASNTDNIPDPVTEALKSGSKKTLWGILTLPDETDSDSGDWVSASAPILAMQKLITQRHPHEGRISRGFDISNGFDTSLSSILNPNQVSNLLELFNLRYSPWLNLPCSLEANTPLLDLVRCTVTSRHLGAEIRSNVSPRLQKLTEDAIARQIFHPNPSIEAVHSLLILSLWSPICGGVYSKVRDGRLLAASAVGIAMNLHLSQSSARALSLREEKHKSDAFSSAKSSEFTIAINKARLWITLANSESMLCIGTGRKALSSRSDPDRNILNVLSFVTSEQRADMRSGIMTEMMDLTECGTGILLGDPSNMNTWYKNICEVLVKMDRLERIITQLPLVAEHDLFYFQMLKVYYYGGRLLVLYHVLRDASMVLQLPSTPGKPWFDEITHREQLIIRDWGQESLHVAELVIVSVLSYPDSDPMLLGTAPDNIFAYVSFAAALLILTRFSVMHHYGKDLPGFTDVLLAKTINRLSRAAYAPDHSAQKCAQVITTMVATWEERAGQWAEKGKAGRMCVESADDQSSPPKKEAGIAPVLPTRIPDPPISHEFNQFTNQDILLDADFWSSFMTNMSTESDLQW